MSNGAAFRKMEEFRQRIETMGTAVLDDAGPEMAKELQTAILSTAAQGEDPDGKKWAARKRDGQQALPNVKNKLRVVYYSRTLIAVLGFPYSLHHWGKAKGRVQRQVLPSNVKHWYGAVVGPLSKAFRKQFG